MTNGIKDLGDLKNEILAHDVLLNKQVQVVEGSIVINVEYEYVIELDRCDTHPKILAWVVHLCEKTWMTPDVLQRFVYLASNHHGLELSQP